tara:strand:- start:5287 stop:6321 length:1035 start_codon:yes stop_codon:yes gene_type:complete
MNIFITGGFGFIGSNFILQFINQNNINILNYDKLTYAGNLENLKSIENFKNYRHVIGDVCDKELVKSSIEDFEPDIILHFAAESHVDRSIKNPFEFIETNVLGTSVLLNESLNYYKQLSNNKKSRFKFVHISTDEVYGSILDGSFDEDSNFSPNSPYSASKASAEHFVKAWSKTFKLPINIVNCTNNYGPFQYPEKLIPVTILNCMLNKSIPIYGKGDNVRDWIYVEDHCDAIFQVIKNASPGEKYNIGSKSELTNIELVKSICKLMDEYYPSDSIESYFDLIKFVEDRPGHDFRYSLNIDKINNDLNWTPLKNINEGLENTVKWYIDNKAWWKRLLDREKENK